MALKVCYQYDTASRNVILDDGEVEVYDGVDVRDSQGVQYDVYLVCELDDTGPFVNLRRGDFYGVVHVTKNEGDYEEDDSYFLDVDLIWSDDVSFNHVVEPELFDTSSNEAWELLALDAVEGFLRAKTKPKEEVVEPIQRRSRYVREPVI